MKKRQGRKEGGEEGKEGRRGEVERVRGRWETRREGERREKRKKVRR